MPLLPLEVIKVKPLLPVLYSAASVIYICDATMVTLGVSVPRQGPRALCLQAAPGELLQAVPHPWLHGGPTEAGLRASVGEDLLPADQPPFSFFFFFLRCSVGFAYIHI